MPRKKTEAPKPETAIRTRGVEVRANSWDEDKRTATIVISTETPVRMGDTLETLLMKGAEFPTQVPFLDSHNRWEIADHIGSVSNIRIEDGALIGDARLARTPRADMAASLIADGHLTDVSVGYKIEKDGEEYIPAGQTVVVDGKSYGGPMYLVRKWAVMEVSAVSIGANPMAKIRNEEAIVPDGDVILEHNRVKAHIDKESRMSEENGGQPKGQPEPIDVNAIREAARKAELARVQAIREQGRMVNADQTLTDELINSGVTVDEANKRYLELFKAEHKPVPTNIQVTRDSHETLVEGITQGIMLRAGLPVEEKHREHARQYAGGSIADLARLHLESQGERGLPLDKESLLKLAFSKRRQRASLTLQGLQGLHTRALGTSDFASLLANVANKALAVAYVEQPATYDRWVRKVSIPDFKSRSVPQLSGVADLAIVAQGAPITNSSLSDRTETYSVGTYAKIIPLTREALINDDLSAFSRLPAMAGAAAKRTVNKSVYNIINAGATSAWNMSDAVALFDASTHKNYGTTATALAVATLQTGRKTMRVQTGLAGEVLNVEPRFLITTPANEMTAAELLTSDARVASGFSAGVVNVFRNTMTLIIEAEMEVGTSGAAASWALAADPNQIDTVEVGFLNGVDMPTLEEQDDFDTFGTRWRVFIDFGVKPIDWRGLYKATGAG